LCSVDLGEAGTVKRRVAQQVIVVSGASSGIGRAVRAPPAPAARTSSSPRANAEALDNAVRELEAAGGQGLAVVGDATGQIDAESLCARAVERFGRIDTFAATVMGQNRSPRPTTCGRRFPATRALRRRPAPDERLAGEAPPAR
jgi:NAD(P)-dependent dehydrogenase (short-subunit alcohol dehydrogenase family)